MEAPGWALRPYSSLVLPSVADQAETAMKAFQAQRDMLKVVSKAKKPSDGDFQGKCLPATSELLGQVQSKVDRKSKNFNNLQALGESIRAELGRTLHSLSHCCG